MRILPYLLFFIFSFNSFAQESEIKGKVIKADAKKNQKQKNNLHQEQLITMQTI